MSKIFHFEQHNQLWTFALSKIPFTFKLLKLINYLGLWNEVFDGRYFKDLEISFTGQTKINKKSMEIQYLQSFTTHG